MEAEFAVTCPALFYNRRAANHLLIERFSADKSARAGSQKI